MKTPWFAAACAAVLSLAMAPDLGAQATSAGAQGGTQPNTTPVTPDNTGEQTPANDPDATPPLDQALPVADSALPIDPNAPPTDPATTDRSTSDNATDLFPNTDTQRDDAGRDEKSPATAPKNADADSRLRGQFEPGFEFSEDADVGMRVGTVTIGSVAAQAELRENDRVISIDGRTFTSADEFRSFAPQLEGRQIPIIVERNGQQQTISLFYPATTTIRQGTATGSRPWLGVYLSPDFTGGGAQVSRIARSSPAARSGLRPGDVIISLNGQDVADYRDLIDGVSQLVPNSSAELYVFRDGRSIPLVASFGRLQSSGYRGTAPSTYGYDPYDNDRMPPAPDRWTAPGSGSDQDRMNRLERMVEELQREVRELKLQLTANANAR